MSLSRTEQLFLKAIRAAICKEKVSWECVQPEEWNALMVMAAQHKLQPLVLDAVHSCPAVQQWDQFSAQKRLSKAQVLSQTIRTTEFFSVYDNLCSLGCRPLVVKGLLCRSLYPNGDLRQSADEDIYVTEADFPICCRALEELGLTATSERNRSDAYEIGWRKPNGALYIELHKSLFSPNSSAVNQLQIYFQDAFENAQKYLVDGREVYSLCPHDHLLYLILHAYKHFIHSGFGIRQISDIGLWAKTYADKIDWTVLYEQCKTVHALKFAAAVFDLAIQFFAIEIALPPMWKNLQVDSAPLLEDSLSAGVYGSSNQSRAHSASLIFSSVAAEREQKRSTLLQTVFPGKKKLENSFPILKKSGFFLPFVWCVRLWRYWKETKRVPDNQMSESLRIARERKRLLKYYEIIDSQ